MAIDRDIKTGSDLYEGDVLYSNHPTLMKFKVTRVGRKWVTVRYGSLDIKFSVDEAYPFFVQPGTFSSFRLFKSKEAVDTDLTNQKLSDAARFVFRDYTFRLPAGVTVSDAKAAMELLGLRDEFQAELDRRGVTQ